MGEGDPAGSVLHDRGVTPGSHTQSEGVPLVLSGWRPELLLSILRRPNQPPNNERVIRHGTKCQ